MRVDTLLSPGVLSNGIRLRTEAARAISAAEIASSQAGDGRSTLAQTLVLFFQDCVSKLPASMRDSIAPTITARTAPAATPKIVTMTFSEGLEQDIVPDASAFTFAPAKTISNIVVDGTKVIITVTANVANGDTIAYAQPGTNGLRDPAGNLVASAAATAIVVA